jgi:hypothetical protein
MQNNRENITDEPLHAYINNAGLVLLHPFIHPCFERLKYLEQDAFINEEKQHKAVHLLKFLVTGNEPQPEDHLIYK